MRIKTETAMFKRAHAEEKCRRWISGAAQRALEKLIGGDMNDHDHHIPKDELDKLKNPEVIKQQREEGVTFQEILGYTNDQMETYYQIAKGQFDRQDFKEAKDSFTFLSTLNPYTSSYWVGLGMCEQLLESPKVALVAYAMATLSGNSDPLPYYHSATCYLAVDDKESAISSLKMAIKYADSSEQYKLLKEQAQSRLDSLSDSSDSEQ